MTSPNLNKDFNIIMAQMHDRPNLTYPTIHLFINKIVEMTASDRYKLLCRLYYETNKRNP